VKVEVIILQVRLDFKKKSIALGVLLRAHRHVQPNAFGEKTQPNCKCPSFTAWTIVTPGRPPYRRSLHTLRNVRDTLW
jgi:hypothetical protein